MLTESDKKLLSYMGVDQKASSFSLHKVHVTGEIELERYYLSNDNDAGVTPISSSDSNAYIAHLQSMLPVHILSWTRADGEIKTQLYSTNELDPTSAVNLSQAATRTIDNGAGTLYAGAIISAGSYAYDSTICEVAHDVIDGGGFFKKTATGFLYTFKAGGGTQPRGNPVSFAIPDGVKKSFNADAIPANETSRATRVNWPALSTDNDLGAVLLELARAGYCRKEDFMTNIPMGASWTSWNINDSSRTIYHPTLPGCRRVVVFMNHAYFNGSGADITRYYTLAFAGYVWGEGDDIFAYATGSLAGNTVTRKVSLGLIPDTYRYGVGIAAEVSREAKAFPLDGVSMLNSNIVGQLSAPTASKCMFGLATVNVYDYDMVCDFATGNITPSDFYEYLTTGFGLFTPKTVEDAQKIVATWSKVSNGLYYKIDTVNIPTPRSLKELEYYRQYVKMRSRACKDNDFMELPYNQEYTMKQVENKLAALVSRSCWIQNGATTSRLVSEFVNVGTITISANADANMFTASIYSKQTGVTTQQPYAKTETGVTNMVNAYLGYTISDPTGQISSLLGNAVDGSALADVSSAMNVEKKQYDLRAAGYISGVALSYADMVMNNVSKESLIALLCSQVTDFVKFEGVLQRWLKDFSHAGVVARLSNVSEFYKSIDISTIDYQEIVV